MKKYISELFGTFILVFTGTCTAVMVGMNPDANVGTFGIAVSFGLAVIAAAYSIGHISGGHLNPAVSWAMFMDKRLSFKDFIMYSISQIIGGILGSSLIWILFNLMKEEVAPSFAANVHGSLTPVGALVSEIVFTFIFVFVILSVTKTKFIAPSLAVVIIGFTLILLHLAGIPLSGASLNPARSIGPAIFTGGQPITDLWVYIVGPMIGASISVLLNNFLDSSEVTNID